MKIRLNNKDVLQLARAIKGGCIDTDKVACLKKLVDNYNPPEQISDDDLEIYLKSLLVGWRLVPLTMSEWRTVVLDEWEDDEIRKRIIDVGVGVYYKWLVKRGLTGLLALGTLNCCLDSSDDSNPGGMVKLLCEFFKIGRWTKGH